MLRFTLIWATSTTALSDEFLPLPVTLGGLYVAISDITSVSGDLLQVPILGLCGEYRLPVGIHGVTLPCDAVNAVTVQIPFELTPPRGDVTSPSGLDLGFSDNSLGGSQIIYQTRLALAIQFDAIHIIREGETLTGPVSMAGGVGFTPGIHQPLITHANGSTVSITSPAKVGETIAIWAVGLGLPSSGTAVTGAANPSPALTTTVNVDYVFRPNSGPSMPWPPPGSSITPSPGDSHVPAITVPAYFAPGYVGLYQVNVTIPTPPVPLQPCGGVFQSNVTVNIGG